MQLAFKEVTIERERQLYLSSMMPEFALKYILLGVGFIV
jgi:hypothetical protein